MNASVQELKSPRRADERVDITVIPMVGVHLVAFIAPFFVGVKLEWLVLTAVVYFFGMFGITAGFHRYFAHRAYKTSRPFQFILALLGTLTCQKGALWWASHHRTHHRTSDTEEDIHSPVRRGFWWAHILWIVCRRYDETDYEGIKDFAKYPELVWLNKHFLIVNVVWGHLMWLMFGWGGLVWGFFVATVLLWHCTFTINSLTHLFGKKRYDTGDESRNHWFFALITLGEGWHNNHHYYQSTANQGFFWWEIDISYYVLRLLSVFGIVWDLRTPPAWVLKNEAPPSQRNKQSPSEPSEPARERQAA